MSRGAKALLEIVKQLYPNQRIELEYNVANFGALFLDIYLPRLGLAFEFDGEQHFKYVQHFHGNRQGFLNAKKRDLDKNETCKEKKITLIRVAFDEEMTREIVCGKVEEALNG